MGAAALLFLVSPSLALAATEAWDQALAQQLGALLTGGRLPLAFAAALAGGFVTALTPCVYPLIPVTLRYFGGSVASERGTVLRLAFFYVLGMTTLYAVLGTAFAALGVVFGSFLSSPWVLGAIAALGLMMGLSMLGAFTLQLPVSVSSRLGQLGSKKAGGAFAMGLVSGLIAAPCTGPSITLILAMIATTGQLGLGFGLMVAFAWGLGLPFMALAFFAGQLQRLPKSGAWMETVKVVLAMAMFAFAAYFALLGAPQVKTQIAAAAAPAQPWLSTTLAIVGVVLVAALGRIGAASLKRLLTITAVVATTVGFVAFVSEAPTVAEGITWIRSHDEGLAHARSANKAVMIDFTADWCAACKELEKHTFADQEVQREAATRFVSMRLDATEPNDAMDELMQRYNIMGLPTVVFIGSDGNVLPDPRVTGFVPPERFIALMQKVR